MRISSIAWLSAFTTSLFSFNVSYASDWVIPSESVAPEGVWVSDMVGLEGKEDQSSLGRFLGSLLIMPEINASTQYESNIFRTENSTESDFIHTIAPQLHILSDWENHEINIDAGMKAGRYHDTKSEDFDDWHVNTQGRINVLESTEIRPFLNIKKVHEDRSNPETSTQGQPLTTFREVKPGLTIEYKSEPGLLRATLESANRDYNSEGTLDNDDRDVRTTRAELRAGYFVTDDITLFVQPARETYHFERDTDQMGIDRDASATELLGGFTYDVTEITLLDVAGGVTQYDTDDATLEDQDAFTLRASLEWQPMENLEIEASAGRTTGVSNIQSVSSLTTSHGAVEGRYALRDDISLRGQAGYRQTEFDGSAREDETLHLGAILEYYLNRSLRTAASYQFQTRDSNATGESYDNNTFMLTLGLVR